MKKIRKIILLATSVCMLFSGCSQGKEVTGNSKFEFTGYPIKTDVTLTYWKNLDGLLASTEQNFGDSPLGRALEEKTGIHVEYIHPPLGQESEQLGILLSTDELPDIIGNNWYTYSGGPSKALREKIILPLNDVLDQYAPNLKAYLASNAEVDKMLKTDDGTYYTFPFIRGDEILCVNQGIVIRGDWLDELGLSMPETIDEWHEVLTQFKEKKGAAAPLVYSGKNMLTNGGFIGAFGIKQDFFVEDGKVLFGPADARYQDFLATFAQWYDEGLLDENIANIDWKGMTANVINGKSGAAFGFAGSGMGQWNTSLREKDPDAHVVAAPFVAEKKNEKPKFGNLDWPYVGTGAAITTSCKNVELAARFMDYAYSEEGNLLYNFGIEGESYTMVNGYPTYTDIIMNNPEGLSMSQAMARYILANTAGSFVQRREYVEQYYNTQEQKDALTVWGNSDTAQYMLPLVTFTPEENEEIGKIMTDVNTFVEEKSIQFIMGKESLDSFDRYMATLEQYGIGRVLEIYNAAYQRYIKRT